MSHRLDNIKVRLWPANKNPLQPAQIVTKQAKSLEVCCLHLPKKSLLAASSTKENLRTRRVGAKPPRVVLRFSEFSLVFLGFHQNHPGFHPGRLSTLYVCIYIYIRICIHVCACVCFRTCTCMHIVNV